MCFTAPELIYAAGALGQRDEKPSKSILNLKQMYFFLLVDFSWSFTPYGSGLVGVVPVEEELSVQCLEQCMEGF